jgi:hypothetical protein
MSWLDSLSMKWTAPYDAAALAQYRLLEAKAPAVVQVGLTKLEGWYNLAMATQDPRVKVRPTREHALRAAHQVRC